MTRRPYQFIPLERDDTTTPQPGSAYDRYLFWRTIRTTLWVVGVVALGMILHSFGGALIIGVVVLALWSGRNYRRRSNWGAWERVDRRPSRETPVQYPDHPY